MLFLNRIGFYLSVSVAGSQGFGAFKSITSAPSVAVSGKGVNPRLFEMHGADRVSNF